jgi:hypothetical protein
MSVITLTILNGFVRSIAARLMGVVEISEESRRSPQVPMYHLMFWVASADPGEANSTSGRRCIHKSIKAIKRGQAVEVAKPRRRDDQSAVTPTSHGMSIPPRFPKAASNPNMEAPPRGKRSAATPRVVGHKQLPAKPTATLAARATAGQGAKQASRKSTTEVQQQPNISAIESTRRPISPAKIRPRAMAAEKVSSEMLPIHFENPRLISA